MHNASLHAVSATRSTTLDAEVPRPASAGEFSYLTVIENGLERPACANDRITPPDVFILIGANHPTRVIEQLKAEVLRKGLTGHFIGDGRTELSIDDIENYREKFLLGNAQGITFAHGISVEKQHVARIGKEYIETAFINKMLRNQIYEDDESDAQEKWTGMMNYFSCQLGKMREHEAFMSTENSPGVTLFHSSGKVASTETLLINALAVLDYLGDCKANKESPDPHALLAWVTDVSGESVTLTGLPSGVPLLVRAPKNIVEADPSGFLSEISTPSPSRERSMVSGNATDIEKFAGLRRSQMSRSKQHLHTKIYSMLLTQISRGNLSEMKNILQRYPEMVNGLPGRITPAYLIMLAWRDRVTGLRTLQAAGADLTLARSEFGETLMHITVDLADRNTLRFLLEETRPNDRNYLLSAKSRDGNTPLHVAAEAGNTEAVEALLRAGANPLERNQNGQSALDLARLRKTAGSTEHDQTIRVLRTTSGASTTQRRLKQ